MDKDSEFEEFNMIYGNYNNEKEYISKERIRKNKEIESKRNERLRRNSRYDANEQGNYRESHLESQINSNIGEDIIQLPQISFTKDEDLNEEFINKGVEYFANFWKETPFIDKEFFGKDALYFESDSVQYNIDWWKRMKDMKDSNGNEIKNPVVFENGCSGNTIMQGQLEDWWFLSAISWVAYSHPELIK